MKKVNKVDEVTNIILSKIVSNEWKSGMKIPSEPSLAKQFGVSRSTIRSAIDKVVTMDILTKKQGSGTYVKNNKSKMFINGIITELNVSKFNLIDIIEFRELIEPECVKLFIRRYDEEKVKYLEELCEKSLHDEWSEEMAILDLNFHFEIIKGSENPVVMNVMQVLGDILKEYQINSNKIIGENTGPEEHLSILNYIKNRDEEMASLLMKRHLQRSKKDLLMSNNKATVVDLSSFMNN